MPPGASVGASERQTSADDSFWFRERGDTYVVRDPALVAEAQAAAQPLSEVGGEMGRVGAALGRNGAKMGRIGGRMGAIAAREGVRHSGERACTGVPLGNTTHGEGPDSRRACVLRPRVRNRAGRNAGGT